MTQARHYYSLEQPETQDYRRNGEFLDRAQVAQEVDYALFWHPSFVHGADRRNIKDLELACTGLRISEDSGQVELTSNWLPHWKVGPNLEKLDEQSAGSTESEYGLAVVVRGDEANPADIYYFDSLGRVVGYRSTAHHSPNALGKDRRMHPVNYVHTSWILNEADQVERQTQVTQWADGSAETMEDWDPISWAEEHPTLIN